MKKGIILIVLGIFGSIAVTACGPSQDEINEHTKLMKKLAAQQAHAREATRKSGDAIDALDVDSLNNPW